MNDFEKTGGMDRAELMQRIELMETMIAEGRRSTCQHAWIFVLWGLVDCAAYGWLTLLPQSNTAGRWAWPVCLMVGTVLTLVGTGVQRRKYGASKNTRSRSIEAVWSMMGVAMGVYVASAMVTHFTWQFSYLAAVLTILGMAHGISAVILRWRAQGVVAALWFAGAAAIFAFNSRRAANKIFLAEMCLGMIAFGVYAMILERRGGAWGHKHG